jgi:hypothetical protein
MIQVSIAFRQVMAGPMSPEIWDELIHLREDRQKMLDDILGHWKKTCLKPP